MLELCQQIIAQWLPTIASILSMVAAVVASVKNVKKIADNSKDKLVELKEQIKQEHCINNSIQQQNLELKKQVEELIEKQKELIAQTAAEKAEAVKASEQARANKEQLATIANDFKTIKTQLKQTLRNK